MKQTSARHRHYRIAPKYRDYLASNLALLLNADVPIQEAFDSLKETSKSKMLNKALDQMKRDIDEGIPLWRALDAAGVASQQTLALVRIGEESGRLVENLRVAARQEEKQRIFRSKVRSAMMYPSFVLGLTLIISLLVAWFLLPRLAETFTQLGAKLPPISLVLINIGFFLRDYGIWAVPAMLAALGAVLYILFGNAKTKFIGQSILFHVPGISRLLHEVEVARFGFLLGTLMEAGLSVTESLQSLHDATTSRRYKKLYQKLRDSFDDGYSFRSALPTYKPARKLIPPPVQQMVIAGERSGSLAEALKTVGSVYEEKADLSTQNLEAILEPILLIIVWLGVLGVAVAVILPVYSLVGGLGA